MYRRFRHYSRIEQPGLDPASRTTAHPQIERAEAQAPEPLGQRVGPVKFLRNRLSWDLQRVCSRAPFQVASRYLTCLIRR